MKKIQWQNDDYTSQIISCLPDLGKAIQSASFYYPPDIDQYDMQLNPWHCFPTDYDDLVWQVEFSILPLLRKWFLGKRPTKLPKPIREDEDWWEGKNPEDARMHYIQMVFGITSYLAQLGRSLPYGEVALRLMLDPSWGEVVNSAAVLGLMYLGEKDVSSVPFEKLFCQEGVDLQKKWKEIHLAYRQLIIPLDPDFLPMFYWRPIFHTLRGIIDGKNPLIPSMLAVAWKKENEWSEEVCLLALDLGVITPLTITGLNMFVRPENRDRFIEFAKMAVKSDDFRAADPDLAEDLQQWIERIAH